VVVHITNLKYHDKLQYSAGNNNASDHSLALVDNQADDVIKRQPFSHMLDKIDNGKRARYHEHHLLNIERSIERFE
jgi:hypothetical protein